MLLLWPVGLRKGWGSGREGRVAGQVTVGKARVEGGDILVTTRHVRETKEWGRWSGQMGRGGEWACKGREEKWLEVVYANGR